MAINQISDEVRRGIKQCRELEDRFLNGSVDPLAARHLLQDLIEGKFSSKPTYSEDVRIQRASAFLELHGDGQEGFRPFDIPLRFAFTPRTTTEVQLLAVYLPDKGQVTGLQRTFDAWWDIIVPPAGFTKRPRGEFHSDSGHLRLDQDAVDYVPGIRWVVFDPNTYQGLSPKVVRVQSAIDGITLAGVEALMAAAQFPGWVASWDGDKSPYPNMSALRLNVGSNTDWSRVPFLNRWGDDRRLSLRAGWVDSDGPYWASPSVREC